MRRFPLALLFSLFALASAIALHHKSTWGVPEDMEGSLVRVLLLWPFALFGNVGWAMRRERDSRPVLRGLLVGGLLLFGAYWILPAYPQHEELDFWFRYWLLGAALLVAAAGYPARRNGHPDLWDSAWPVGLAAFMATLSAMLVVGGVCLALVSVEKLFDVDISDKLYFDIFLTGFFLLAPITAFAWLPDPFGERQPQPHWLKGTARIVLTPLCLLYALIMVAYIGKIAVAARWPDGWVAMPTLIFGALGLTAYFIARPARDRDAEVWAKRFCRIFPLVLLPLAVTLVLAMRVRVSEYGFTEWRVIGSALGLWLVLFATAYSVRPRLSPWWIASSLVLLCVLLAIGPLSAPHLSLNSQRTRLDTLLTEAGVRTGEPVTIEGDDGRRIRSGIEYLLQHHGPEGLPSWVQERWAARQEDGEEKSTTKRTNRHRRRQATEILKALDITLVDERQHVWHRVRCDMQAMALADYRDLTLCVMRHTNQLPVRVDHEIRVWAEEDEIAQTEREQFVESFLQALEGKPSGEVILPVDQMTLVFSHAGEEYVVIFPELNVNTRRQADGTINIRHYGGVYLAFRRDVQEAEPAR